MKKIHTHYDNLKVSRGAPAEVIRAAYRALAQKYHPDRNSGDAEAVRIMKAINASYEVLSDPGKRHEHDKWIVQQELLVVELKTSIESSHCASSSSQSSEEDAATFGLTEEDIDYLGGRPIRAIHYLQRYQISEGDLSKAIGLAKIRGVLCRGVLWVQDRRIP